MMPGQGITPSASHTSATSARTPIRRTTNMLFLISPYPHCISTAAARAGRVAPHASRRFVRLRVPSGSSTLTISL